VYDVLQYRIADVDVAVEGPADILKIMAESYRRFPNTKGRAAANAHVRAEGGEGGDIAITIGEKNYTTVSPAAGRATVGLELSNAIITAVAQRSRFLIVHAAVVERDGAALCIAARGHAGKTLLASHLLSRGWHCLSDEYAFIEPLSGHIVPFPKLLYVRSSSLRYVPRTFRRSIECSPWYGFGDSAGLVFSGVDPAESYSESTWSEGARLESLLVLRDRNQNGPVIEECAAWSIIPELNALTWQPPDLLDGLSRMASALRGVRVGKLTAGSPLVTVDAIERWASGAGHLSVYA
jgi:hypothetical protein